MEKARAELEEEFQAKEGRQQQQRRRREKQAQQLQAEAEERISQAEADAEKLREKVSSAVAFHTSYISKDPHDDDGVRRWPLESATFPSFLLMKVKCVVEGRG